MQPWGSIFLYGFLTPDYHIKIHKKLEVFLASEGVSKIECQGELFDPLQHEALSTEETNEYESGVVTKVLRNGYKLRDRVIQPAQVVVAKPISN